jgi:hypothetical protein
MSIGDSMSSLKLGYFRLATKFGTLTPNFMPTSELKNGGNMVLPRERRFSLVANGVVHDLWRCLIDSMETPYKLAHFEHARKFSYASFSAQVFKTRFTLPKSLCLSRVEHDGSKMRAIRNSRTTSAKPNWAGLNQILDLNFQHGKNQKAGSIQWFKKE